jgi:hypothetical protein
MGGCFSLGWIENLCVWLIVVCAVVAIIRLLVPFLTGLIGMPIVAQIINIVLWAVVAIMAVYIIFALLSCLLGAGGGLMHFPR